MCLCFVTWHRLTSGLCHNCKFAIMQKCNRRALRLGMDNMLESLNKFRVMWFGTGNAVYKMTTLREDINGEPRHLSVLWKK